MASVGGEMSSHRCNSDQIWRMKHAPIKWAVDGILPEGVTLLCGKPKVGKSWCALDIALGVAAGGFALGTAKCGHGIVLYLALEDTERRITRRLRKLCPDEAPDGVDFFMDWPRLGAGGEDKITHWLDTHPDARLIVIDTLAGIRPAANSKETLYQNDYAVGQFLAKLLSERPIAILIVHHTRKMQSNEPIDRISGTLGLPGGVDGFLILERDPVGTGGTLTVNGRDVEESGEFALDWDKNAARWRLTGGDPRIQKLIPGQRRVVSVLVDGPKTVREITEALHPGHAVDDPAKDHRYASVARSLRRLRETGLVGQNGRKWEMVEHTGITVSAVSPNPTVHHTDTADTNTTTDTAVHTDTVDSNTTTDTRSITDTSVVCSEVGLTTASLVSPPTLLGAKDGLCVREGGKWASTTNPQSPPTTFAAKEGLCTREGGKASTASLTPLPTTPTAKIGAHKEGKASTPPGPKPESVQAVKKGELDKVRAYLNSIEVEAEMAEAVLNQCICNPESLRDWLALAS